MSRCQLICLLLFFVIFPARAEEAGIPEPPVLRPKTRVPSPEEPPTLLKPKTIRKELPKPEGTEEKKAESPKDLGEIRRSWLSFLVTTPLFYGNIFESRFHTLGLAGLLRFYLFPLSAKIPLYLQIGLHSSVSRIDLTQPNVSFSHTFVDVPLLLDATLTVNEKLGVDIFAGGFVRALEYDSRDTNDGGWSTVRSTPFLLPDVGMGVVYQITPGVWNVRVRASYLTLALGFEFAL